jgi:PAS domain-containing protein
MGIEPDKLEHQVAAAEFVRRFAEHRKISESVPLLITSHGRATHVMLGIDAYTVLGQRSRKAEADRHDGVVGRVSAELADLATEALVFCEPDGRCVHLNPVALAFTRYSLEQCRTMTLAECFPEISGTLFETQINRTSKAHEPTAADIPSPFVNDGWVHLRSITWHHQILIGFRDITEEMERTRRADARETMIEAMSVHGDVGYARLSVRGTIERLSVTISERVGIDPSRLEGAPFVNLVDLPQRSGLRDSLEKVLRENAGFRERVRLIGNNGEAHEVTLAVNHLGGAYGPEGAMVLLTFDRT